MAQYDTVYASKISLSWEIVVFSLVFVNQMLISTSKDTDREICSY